MPHNPKQINSRHLPSADRVERANLDDLTPEQLQDYLAFTNGLNEERSRQQQALNDERESEDNYEQRQEGAPFTPDNRS